jgi:hypothetical protein
LTKIAFLLLCHQNAQGVEDQVRALTSRGDCVTIHADLNAGPEFRADLERGCADMPNVTMAKSVRCGWGEWSLVQATLNMIETARHSFPDATHFFLMSGDCMPIKPAEYLHETLRAADRDYIQHADFFEDNWIKTGMTKDRLVYRHWFNERKQKRLFYASLNAQRKLGLSRSIPKGLKMKIGSQWWVLRRNTIDLILKFISERRDVVRFFKTTWIPDETFFQTLTMKTVAREEVENNPPSFLMFSDYGKPVTFYADHFEMLCGQWQFAARKISQNDLALRSRLAQLYSNENAPPHVDNSGTRLYEYIRARGRAGARFAPRIWEDGARLGTGFDLTVILCKKWHIGNRIAHLLSARTNRATYGYVFDEEAPSLPDLGGYERGQDKRNRHRRAFLNILAAHDDTRALVICLDPANLDALTDFAHDGCTLRMLDVQCETSDEWIAEHASRIGLGTTTSNGALQSGLIRSLRQNMREDKTRLDALKLPHHHVIVEGQTPGQMSRTIAAAFDISIDDAARIARTEELFE